MSAGTDGFQSSECLAGNHDNCDREVKRDCYCTCPCHDVDLWDGLDYEEEPCTPTT